MFGPPREGAGEETWRASLKLGRIIGRVTDGAGSKELTAAPATSVDEE